jgi:hypothetical protein
MPIDRLHRAPLREDHQAVVLRGLRDAMRSGLHLLRGVFGWRDFLREPGYRIP